MVISAQCVVSLGERLPRRFCLIAFLLCLQVSLSAATQPTPSVGGGAMCGEFSSIRLSPQEINFSQSSPTRLKLMAARWASLQQTLAGYEQTGVPLVGAEGTRLVPTGTADDGGLDYFVPRLAAFLKLPLAESVDIFLGGILIGSFGLGLAGLLLFLRSPWTRYLAVFEVFVLAIFCLRVGDVYLVPAAAVLAVVPWVLYFSRMKRPSFLFLLFLVLAGMGLGAANLLRTHSGTAVMLFCIPILGFLVEVKPRWRMVMLASLISGLLISTLYFRHAFTLRDTYLRNQLADYVAAPRQHPMWHSFYIGLGFVSNPYVAGGYCDEVAVEKVRSISPGAAFLSPEYDLILAKEVSQIAMHHPYVLLVNLVAKLGILQMIVLLVGNIAWWAAFYSRRPRSLDLAFLIAIGFSALPGLLVIPVPKYLLGCIALVVVYALVSIDYAAQQGALRRLIRTAGSEEKILCVA
jgi:hypothetical protein